MALNPELALRLIFIFAWTNVLGLILVLLSCRCTPVMLPNKLVQSKFYQAFYKWHCYYWWFFIVSVLVHAIIAIIRFK